MGRKSTIDKQAPEVKGHLHKRLRENRLTLDELLTELRERFPEHAAELPSRSAIHRHSQSIADIVAHEREMAVASEALVAELGNGVYAPHVQCGYLHFSHPDQRLRVPPDESNRRELYGQPYAEQDRQVYEAWMADGRTADVQRIKDAWRGRTGQQW